MTNIIILQIKSGYNIQDVKFRLRYFFGEQLTTQANPRESKGYILLNMPLKSYEGVKDNLPCSRVDLSMEQQQFLKN